MATPKSRRFTVKELKEALTILRNSYFRTADPKHPNTVFVSAEAWVQAFAPLIVPPYNKLAWE